MERRNWITVAALLLLVTAMSAIAVVRFAQGPADAERRLINVEKIKDLGTTTSLVVLPLVEQNASQPGLAAESGVSYLVKTDRNMILFDVGANSNGADPSPLLRNMQQLGISLDKVDLVFISHKHADHLGGSTWYKSNTFSLGNRQVDLTGKRVYVPDPMTYPGLVPVFVNKPAKLAEGVATIGTLSFESSIPIGDLPAEQALAVNVQGRGIVLISGCGHPTLQKIVLRAEALFDEPVIGILGGLHYPGSDGRDVKANIDLLSARHPQVVGLSPHDSSPAAIQAFRDAFPEVYRDISAGQPITVTK